MRQFGVFSVLKKIPRLSYRVLQNRLKNDVYVLAFNNKKFLAVFPILSIFENGRLLESYLNLVFFLYVNYAKILIKNRSFF